MVSKNQIKHIRSLHQQKFRKMYNLFLAEGPKIVDELLSSRFEIDTILAVEKWIEGNAGRLKDTTEIIVVSEKELERISTLVTPNEVVAVIKTPPERVFRADPAKTLILVLDDIRDPGNMGTLLRTADWFGIKEVVCSNTTVEIYNPKVVQSSMGSLGRIRISYTELPDLLKKQDPSIPIYGAVLNGKNIYEERLSQNGFLVIGSESHGISQAVMQCINHPITIPATLKSKKSRPESLNASVAAAIICAEFRKPSK